jgi:tryptophan synthase beta chain
VLHGTRSYVLQDQDGLVGATHSVSAGLDYPAVGPEHAFWHDSQRVSYVRVSDREALDAFHQLAELEGILPALETAHALAYVGLVARRLPASSAILVNLSGRGDKDVEEVARFEGERP